MNIRQQAVANEAAALLKQGFVLIDLETTGLSHHPNVEIIEIGILNHEGDVLMETFVKPQFPIPPAASAVNQIYDEDVANAPPFEAIYPELSQLLSGKHVIAYNHTFEQDILRVVLKRHKLPPIKSDWWCAMRAYTNYLGRGDRFVKLVNACKREYIVIQDAHRAIGDCRMTLALVQKMAQSAQVN